MEDAFAERLRGLAEQDREAAQIECRLHQEFNVLWFQEVRPAIQRAFNEVQAAFFGRGFQITDSFLLAIRRGKKELSFFPKWHQRQVRVRVVNQHGTESKLYTVDELTEEFVKNLTCDFLETARPDLL